jgi:hypothetical protein
MRRAWCLAVVVALVCLCAGSALDAGSERLINLEFYGLDFHHLIDLFQKEAPDLVFVAAPGVGDMSLTIKTPRPLPLDEAIEAAAGALDLEVHRAGKVVVFRPRAGQAIPTKPPKPGLEATSGTLAVQPWPGSFIGSDMLVDLEVKDKPLSEVANALAEYASAHEIPAGSWGVPQKPMRRRFEIVVVNPASHSKRVPVPFGITAAVYRRPLSEVLGFLTEKTGLTYTVEQKPDKTVISIVPRPSIVAAAYYAFHHGVPAWLAQEDYPHPEPQPQAQATD